MTAHQAVLALGTVTMTGCGAGLVLIHDNNPLLKGLNWMGWALVLGGTAAALILMTGVVPASEPVANVFILLAFMSCYRADQYLIGADTEPGWTEAALAGTQVTASALQLFGVLHSNSAIVISSILVAVQLSMTIRLIQRSTVSRGRLAARFTVGLMSFLAGANLLRGGFAVAGLLRGSLLEGPLNLITYNVFVSAAIALAFAFFWRTTTKLSLELEHMASTDPLTRVYNRRVFVNWCEREQARSRRLAVPFSVLMVDFDHFKRVNDNFGHHVGDQVLCAAVERIQDSIRGIDVLCRWGGEEFAVLLPNASTEATQIVAERVRRNVALTTRSDPRFADARFAALRLSASIGTATFEGDEDNFDAMLQRADAALYEAKRNGRNQVVPSMPMHDEVASLSERMDASSGASLLPMRG